nr:stage II sporulation protein M [Anaerolineae bacterium]
MMADRVLDTGARPQQGLMKRFQWNMSRALIITRREVIDMFRDWRILAPIILLTLIFPTIANWGAGRMVSWVEQYGAEIVAERLIPFLLMVVGFFPISFSLIIALESFVGEKERRSLEPLLSTPLTNIQLYIGKVLSSTVPPLMGSLLGITVYLVGVYFNVNWRPPVVLLIQILLLTIVQAVVMVAGAVVVSSQVTSVRAANLLASFIIIPMAFLIQAEAMIMFWAQYDVLWLILLGLAVIGVALVRMGVRNFNREELLGREIDELNLYSGIQKLWQLVLARRTGSHRRDAWRWYRDEVLVVLWRVRWAFLLIVVALIAAYFIGDHYASVFAIPSDIFILDDWYERFSSILVETGLHGASGILLVIGQNLRVLAVASILATFSLGILAVLILMIPVALVAYLVAQMIAAGMDPMILWSAIMPHSIFEITAAALAGAVALRLGACVLSPPPGGTLSEGWMLALADAIRVWVTLILPMLVLAAFVEILITPNVVLLLVGTG